MKVFLICMAMGAAYVMLTEQGGGGFDMSRFTGGGGRGEELHYGGAAMRMSDYEPSGRGYEKGHY